MEWMFVEIGEVTRRAAQLGLDEDLRKLQNLLAEPRAGALDPGTCGLRKVRMTDTQHGRGKRGGLRMHGSQAGHDLPGSPVSEGRAKHAVARTEAALVQAGPNDRNRVKLPEGLMRDEEFQILLQGVQEAVEHYHGLRHDLRTTILPAPPERMDAAAIRALRERIGASQAVFAMALNVSPKTVQAWESGARTPDGGNLKLLRVGEAHPEAVFGRLYPPAAQAEAKPARPARKPRAAGGPKSGARAA